MCTCSSNLWVPVFPGQGRYPVIDIEEYNRKLYFADANRLYAFDGNGWSDIQSPLDMPSLQSYGDKLYIAGSSGKIYSYDGSTFTEVYNTNSQYAKTLAVYNNKLYAGTYLAKPVKLYYFDGNTWQEDTGFSNILYCPSYICSIDSMGVYNGKMYLGGSSGKIYRYDGSTWSILKTYDDVYAFQDMKVFNGKLYLATRDQSTRCPMYIGSSGFCGRVIEYDGTNWKTVLDYSYPTYHDGYWIYSLEEYHGKLYAGTADKIYMWDGNYQNNWQLTFNSATGAQYALVMKTWNDRIYVGFGNGVIEKDDTLPPTTSTTTSTTSTSTSTIKTTTTVSSCSCTAWGATGTCCGSRLIPKEYWVRTCTPKGCQAESKCEGACFA
jgi:hypothetical protein